MLRYAATRAAESRPEYRPDSISVATRRIYRAKPRYFRRYPIEARMPQTSRPARRRVRNRKRKPVLLDETVALGELIAFRNSIRRASELAWASGSEKIRSAPSVVILRGQREHANCARFKGFAGPSRTARATRSLIGRSPPRPRRGDPAAQATKKRSPPGPLLPGRGNPGPGGFRRRLPRSV